MERREAGWGLGREEREVGRAGPGESAEGLAQAG